MNGRGRPAAVAVLALLLGSSAGCRSPGTPPDLDPSHPTVSIRFSGTPAFGHLVPADITITNTTLDAILIEEVDLDGQLPCPAGRPAALPGGLEHRRAADEYVYDPDLPGATPPLFLDQDLLLSGESRELRVTLRARFFRQGIRVRFRRRAPEDLIAEVYFPVPDPHRRNRVRFRHLPQSLLHRYRSGVPGTVARQVIIPGRERWPIAEPERTVEVPIADPLAPAEVLKGSGASADSAVTRWLGRGSWIIDDPHASRTFGIGAEGRTFELPRTDLEVFDILDLLAGSESVPVYREGGIDPVRRLPAAQAPAFLEAARLRGDRVHAAWAENDGGGFDLSLELEAPAAADPSSPEREGATDS